jgi:hypothetical protein
MKCTEMAMGRSGILCAGASLLLIFCRGSDGFFDREIEWLDAPHDLRGESALETRTLAPNGDDEHGKGLTACAEKTLSEGKRASRASSCGTIFETQPVRFVFERHGR